MAQAGVPSSRSHRPAPAGRNGRPPAAAAGRGRACGGDGGARRARPPARRRRRDLLAVPAIPARRRHGPDRLAAVGALGPAVPARPGVGSGGNRVAVGRRIGLDGVQFGAAGADQTGPGGAPATGVGFALDPCRRAHRLARRSAAADRRTRGGRRPCASVWGRSGGGCQPRPGAATAATRAWF